MPEIEIGPPMFTTTTELSWWAWFKSFFGGTS